MKFIDIVTSRHLKEKKNCRCVLDNKLLLDFPMCRFRFDEIVLGWP